jgi:hypothetical protein
MGDGKTFMQISPIENIFPRMFFYPPKNVIGTLKNIFSNKNCPPCAYILQYVTGWQGVPIPKKKQVVYHPAVLAVKQTVLPQLLSHIDILA